MKQTAQFEDECEVDDGHVGSVPSRELQNRYGSVPGLDDDELADPCELERQVMIQEWGPVLMLPVRGRRSSMVPAVDENGGVDWGAFGTVDFARTMPEFDKARYKVDMLRERYRNVVIMVGIVKERLPKARIEVLTYLEKGVVRLDQIENEDMRALAKLYLQARRLQAEIRQLQETSRRRRRERCAEVLG